MAAQVSPNSTMLQGRLMALTAAIDSGSYEPGAPRGARGRTGPRLSRDPDPGPNSPFM